LILDDPATIERYTRAGWWGQTTVGDLFRRCVQERAGQLALIDPPNRATFTFGKPLSLTFGELDAAVDALAAVMFDAGVRKDAIVVVQLPNIAEIVISFMAAARLGAIVSPVMMAYGERDLRRMAKHLRPACVIAASVFKQQRPAEILRPICAESGAALLELGTGPLTDITRITPDTTAMTRYADALHVDANEIHTLHWTSGTTGDPKCVPRSHNQWHGTGTCCADVGRLQPGDRLLAPMQMVHTAGYSGLVMPWLELQGTIVLHQPFDMSVFLDQLERLQINHTVAAPAMLNALLRDNVLDDHDVSALRTILCGSAPLDPWMIEGYRDRYGIEIVNAFGSTEGLTLFSSEAIATDAYRRARYFPRFSGTTHKPSTGRSWGVRIAAAVEGKLVDVATGAEVTTARTPGEYVFRSPALFPGYWTTEGTLDRRDFDADGYFRSGELFEIAGDGEDADHYHYIDRLKDVINRGGVKIAAGELEAALQALPGVREAAAVAFPEARLGELICAVVVLEPGVSLTLESAIEQLARVGVAKFMLPERLEVLDALPRNATGKVLKRSCVEMLLARSGAAGA
jgi:acyl-CoA synthetase (AMP-forming)/AMP-acid ligase II